MKTPIGIHKETGELCFIEDVVENGLRCNCRCPNEACGADLIAKWCKDKTDHFAHHNKKGGAACKETALHILGKHLIASSKKCFFPELIIESGPYFSDLLERYQGEKSLFNQSYSIANVQVEANLPHFGIKPDILCSTQVQGEELKLAIEVRVTHEVDDEKLDKICKAKMTTIEIDLSDMMDQQEVTKEEVINALSESFRYEWIFVDETFTNRFKTELEIDSKERAEKRNDEVALWQEAVVSYIRKRGTFFKLPAYRYPPLLIKPEIEDIRGRKHPISVSEPPQIARQIEYIGIELIENAVMTIQTKSGGKDYPLPILFESQHSELAKPTCSYLKLDYDGGLPLPERFEMRLGWGHSEKAEQYIKDITQKKRIKEKQDRQVENEVRSQYLHFQKIVEHKNYPLSSHKDSIARDYEMACQELSSQGLNRLPYMVELEDGWIFGCPQEHWQTLLLRTMCIVNNDSVTVPYYADSLKEHHAITAVEPVKSLGFSRKALEHLSIPSHEIPTTYGVLSAYFRALLYQGLLMLGERSGHYKKAMPYGKNYRQMHILQKKGVPKK